jgi:hypothetical protein
MALEEETTKAQRTVGSSRIIVFVCHFSSVTSRLSLLACHFYVVNPGKKLEGRYLYCHPWCKHAKGQVPIHCTHLSHLPPLLPPSHPLLTTFSPEVGKPVSMCPLSHLHTAYPCPLVVTDVPISRDPNLALHGPACGWCYWRVKYAL